MSLATLICSESKLRGAWIARLGGDAFCAPLGSVIKLLETFAKGRQIAKSNVRNVLCSYCPPLPDGEECVTLLDVAFLVAMNEPATLVSDLIKLNPVVQTRPVSQDDRLSTIVSRHKSASLELLVFCKQWVAGDRSQQCANNIRCIIRALQNTLHSARNTLEKVVPSWLPISYFIGSQGLQLTLPAELLPLHYRNHVLLNREELTEEEAAVRIQARFRGYASRKKTTDSESTNNKRDQGGVSQLVMPPPPLNVLDAHTASMEAHNTRKSRSQSRRMSSASPIYRPIPQLEPGSPMPSWSPSLSPARPPPRDFSERVMDLLRTGEELKEELMKDGRLRVMEREYTSELRSNSPYGTGLGSRRRIPLETHVLTSVNQGTQRFIDHSSRSIQMSPPFLGREQVSPNSTIHTIPPTGSREISPPRSNKQMAYHNMTDVDHYHNIQHMKHQMLAARQPLYPLMSNVNDQIWSKVNIKRKIPYPSSAVNTPEPQKRTQSSQTPSKPVKGLTASNSAFSSASRVRRGSGVVLRKSKISPQSSVAYNSSMVQDDKSTSSLTLSGNLDSLVGTTDRYTTDRYDSFKSISRPSSRAESSPPRPVEEAVLSTVC